MNKEQFAVDVLKIKYDCFIKKLRGDVKFNIDDIRNITLASNCTITPNDFLPELSISSDKSNNNNQNLNVKNTTPSVSSDDKQIDVVDTAETQSSEPSEVAKRKVGGK